MCPSTRRRARPSPSPLPPQTSTNYYEREVSPLTTWWYVGGLGLFGILALLLATYVTIPIPGVQAWWAWGMGALAAMFTITSGAWLTRDTLPFRFAGWLIHMHPAIAVAIGVASFAGLVIFILAVLPHVVSPRIAVTTGVAVMAFMLPTVVVQTHPPGKVGHLVTNAVFGVSGQVDRVTAGWFG